jgi:glutamate synthase domain-containing protein 1
VCGIIGLLAKTEEMRRSLGSLITPMFECMAERGPDSAGLAVFGAATKPSLRRFSIFSRNQGYEWATISKTLKRDLGYDAEIRPLHNHAILITAGESEELRSWIAKFDSTLRVLSVGRSIDVFKDVGNPADIARSLQFQALQGSHCVGHTRMATESEVSPAHAHPFTAGEDFCLVHNGSLSNPYGLRRMLEGLGQQFETDNDSEVACRLLQWRMQNGVGLDSALRTAFAELDGFYTFLIATKDQLTLVRDAFACKPAVVAETDQYVAVSSEFRSLAHLPGISSANLFEPLPEQIYSWRVGA